MILKYMTGAIIAMAMLPMQASAATATAQMDVTANSIVPAGSVNNVGAVAFGTVIDTATATTQSSFNVTVSDTLPYTIAMDGGANYNAVTNKSFLKDSAAANAREFVLYQEAARTTVWSPAGSNLAGLTGTGVAQLYNVYGTLLAAAGTTGAVSDVVTITVTY